MQLMMISLLFSQGDSTACAAFGLQSWRISWPRLSGLFEDRGRIPKRVNGSSHQDWDEDVLLDMGW